MLTALTAVAQLGEALAAQQLAGHGVVQARHVFEEMFATDERLVAVHQDGAVGTHQVGRTGTGNFVVGNRLGNRLGRQPKPGCSTLAYRAIHTHVDEHHVLLCAHIKIDVQCIGHFLVHGVGKPLLGGQNVAHLAIIGVELVVTLRAPEHGRGRLALLERRSVGQPGGTTRFGHTGAVPFSQEQVVSQRERGSNGGSQLALDI